jgi:hypothetical protein
MGTTVPALQEGIRVRGRVGSYSRDRVTYRLVSDTT